jgi:dihydroorotate dehydrogenase
LRDWIYEITLKPLFFQLSPEDAHGLSVGLLNLANTLPGIFSLVEKFSKYESPRLKTKVAGIEFSNPLGMAAGFDKTGELYPFLSRLGFGFVEIGTITGEEQPGNPKPRIFRYPKDESLVNRMGFNNPGSRKAQKTISAQQKTIPRGINAGKTKIIPPEQTVGDYIKTFQALAPLGDYGVINISSPNTPGLRGFQEKESFLTLIEGIKKGLGGKFPIPMFVKFAPDLERTALEELLELVIDLQLDGVILTNTTIDPSSLKSYANQTIEQGGISGRVLQSKSTEFIRLARKSLQGKIPIIGVGGIFDGPSALEKIFAGADLIQIYTGYIYKGPFLPYQILEYLDKFMVTNRISKISDLVGQENFK